VAEGDVRIDGYANALFEVARVEGSIAEVEDELFRFARTLESNDELRSVLTDEAVPVARRQGVVEDLLGAKASPVTVNLVGFVVGAGRARQLPQIIGRLVERAAAAKDSVVGEVRSAVPLTEDQRERLAAALGKATGKQVEVKVIVDPTVLGGVVARIGDTVIDGSVRTRLDRLKERL
jgi:F-type H+-transporting ATPase subunit delta